MTSNHVVAPVLRTSSVACVSYAKKAGKVTELAVV